jgi:hypothetical protein
LRPTRKCTRPSRNIARRITMAFSTPNLPRLFPYRE